MQSYEKNSTTDHIICINHTLHLSVLKCLEVYDVEDKDTDKKTLIKKVRSVVHTFKKSPKLQQYLEEHLARESYAFNHKKLIMDCRVRWNSLFRMCERFIHLYPYIKKYIVIHRKILQ